MATMLIPKGTKRKLETEDNEEVEEEEIIGTVKPRLFIQQNEDKDVALKPKLLIHQDGDEDVVIFIAKKVETKSATTIMTPAQRVNAEAKKTTAKRTTGKRLKVEEGDPVVEVSRASKKPAKRAGTKRIQIKDGDPAMEMTGTPKKQVATKAMLMPANTLAEIETVDAFLAGSYTPKKTPKKQIGTLDDFVLRTPAPVKEEIPVEETLIKTPKKPSGNLDGFFTRAPAATVAMPTKKASRKINGFATKTHTAATALSPLHQHSVGKTARGEDAEAEDVPESLSNLVRFHESLLTALLLHKAQNGSGVFPSFAALKPHIERLTSKRVSLEDIRRIIFLSRYKLPAKEKDGGLHLIDYGAGKTVIKFVETPSTKLIHSESLKERFRQLVHEFREDTGAEATVPQAPIQEHLHRATINTVLHGKSQRLIKELKAVPKKNTITFPTKKAAAASARSSGLLERIRAKAAAAEKPPSPEELLQRAAEDRVGEVREVLRVCRAKGESIGLRAAVEKVRESVKNPIGADEAELAVKLVAEMEPWCDVRTNGGVGAVVFGSWEGEGLFA